MVELFVGHGVGGAGAGVLDKSVQHLARVGAQLGSRLVALQAVVRLRLDTRLQCPQLWVLHPW